MHTTAQSITDLILSAVPGMDRERTCDGFKAGDPSREVRKIAVTFMATRSVMAQAVEMGIDLLITHEPTFFNEDRRGELDHDPVVKSKRAFAAEHGLTIWRCHDSIHRMKPDGIVQGMAMLFGWDSLVDNDYLASGSVIGTSVYNLPATTLDQLGKSLKEKLNAPRISPSAGTPGERSSLQRSTLDVRSSTFNAERTSNIERRTSNVEVKNPNPLPEYRERGPVLRVIGPADLPIHRVGLSVGCPGWNSHRALLRHPGVDVLVCGELREWETCEYLRDSAAAGFNQGLIVLGHANSEEAGMRFLVAWLAEHLPQLSVEFIPAGDPFRYL